MNPEPDLIQKFEIFYEILVKVATNGYDQSEFRIARDRYSTLRIDLISNSELKMKIPIFIIDCPTLDDFNRYIRDSCSSSKERRCYLKNEFSSARSFVHNTTIPLRSKPKVKISNGTRGYKKEEDILKNYDDVVLQKSKDCVFIVHGRDDSIKETTARFLEKLGLETIILHEKPDKGRTIIEKFEDHSKDAKFAVVLLTPDDVGRLASEPETSSSPRARQNVIFEMGYFCGKLGRGKLCALYRGVEQPSDLHGVLYIQVDDAGAWKTRLALELREAGLNADFEKGMVVSRL